MFDPAFKNVCSDPDFSNVVCSDPVFSSVMSFDPVFSSVVSFDPVFSRVVSFDPVFSSVGCLILWSAVVLLVFALGQTVSLHVYSSLVTSIVS